MSHWAREGLIGAWCPGVSGANGFLLPDLSGNANHGTLTNMDPPTDWVTSQGAFGLDFDGVDDYVAVADFALFNPTTPHTMSFWVQHRSMGGQKNIFSMTSHTNIAPLVSFGMQDVFNRTQVFYRTSSFGVTSFNSTVISLNRLTHYCVTYDGATLRLWQDGVDSNSAAFSGAIANFPLTRSTIGAWRRTSIGVYSEAIIYEVRLHQTFFSASEVKQLYEGGPGYGLRPQRKRYFYFPSAPALDERFLKVDFQGGYSSQFRGGYNG